MAKQETRDMLVEAFFTIYREKPVNRISIKEVTEKAGFHRSTFYEYFKDIYDLLEQEEEAIFEMQTSLIIEPIEEGRLDIHCPEFLMPLKSLFDMKGEKIAVLIGTNGDAAFSRKMQERLKNVLILRDDSRVDTRWEYIAEFISSGVLSVFRKAYSEKTPIEDVMKVIYPVISRMIP